MHYQDVLFVRHIETPVLVAVVVNVAEVRTEIVRTLGVFTVNVETLRAVILHLKTIDN